MSKPTGIYISEQVEGQAETINVAVNLQNQLTIVESSIRKVNQSNMTLQSYLAMMLQSIGELKMMGYTYDSMRRLLEGKAGLDEVIQITFTVLLMINKLHQIMELTKQLQGASAILGFANMKMAMGGTGGRTMMFRGGMR